MSTLAKTFLTPEEYLKIEREAECKSEYFAGEMFAMAGAVEAHNLVWWNIIGQFYQQLRGRPCRVYRATCGFASAPPGSTPIPM